MASGSGRALFSKNRSGQSRTNRSPGGRGSDQPDGPGPNGGGCEPGISWRSKAGPRPNISEVALAWVPVFGPGSFSR